MVRLVDWRARVRALSDALSLPGGGFSVDPRDGRDVRTGYAVGVLPERARVLDGHVSARELHEFILRVRHALAVPGRVLGGWRDADTGLVHLDVSVVTTDWSAALAIARANRQLAVFDLTDMRCRHVFSRQENGAAPAYHRSSAE